MKTIKIIKIILALIGITVFAFLLLLDTVPEGSNVSNVIRSHLNGEDPIRYTASCAMIPNGDGTVTFDCYESPSIFIDPYSIIERNLLAPPFP